MLSDFYEDFIRQDITVTPDGLGGVVRTITDGDSFQAGISTNNSREAQVAYQQGLKVIYNLIHPLGIILSHGDQVKRVKDGRIYRITSNSQDMTTPAMAQVQYAQVTAEVVEA